MNVGLVNELIGCIQPTVSLTWREFAKLDHETIQFCFRSISICTRILMNKVM